MNENNINMFFCSNRTILCNYYENNWPVFITHRKKNIFFIVEIGLLKSEKTRRKWGKKKKEIKLLMKMSLLTEATLE